MQLHDSGWAAKLSLIYCFQNRGLQQPKNILATNTNDK